MCYRDTSNVSIVPSFIDRSGRELLISDRVVEIFGMALYLQSSLVVDYCSTKGAPAAPQMGV
jgi:hypothetical protein